MIFFLKYFSPIPTRFSNIIKRLYNSPTKISFLLPFPIFFFLIRLKPPIDFPRHDNFLFSSNFLQQILLNSVLIMVHIDLTDIITQIQNDQIIFLVFLIRMPHFYFIDDDVVIKSFFDFTRFSTTRSMHNMSRSICFLFSLYLWVSFNCNFYL